MLLFQTLLLASLSSTTPVAPMAHPTRAPRPAAWVSRLLSLKASWNVQLSVPCASLSGSTGPCVSLMPDSAAAERIPAPGSYAGAYTLKLPRRNDAFRTQGGFVHVDVASSPTLRVGPELSWSTPDSPREDLPKMRLLSPGWGVRLAWGASPIAVGVSACSRILMVGRELPMFDPLTSEARIEFRLP